MAGLSWKAQVNEVIDRHRRFFNREMQDGILVTAPVMPMNVPEWKAYDEKWGRFTDGEARPLPSDEEIFERWAILWRHIGRVEDDSLPVTNTMQDAGEGMVGGLFGQDVRFIHRIHAPTYSASDPLLPDYSKLSGLSFSLDNPFARHVLGTLDYFKARMGDHFAQHSSLTMDVLNFACEIRGTTQAYLDLYEYPEELHELMELGLDFNIRFQEAQLAKIDTYAEGSFVWMGEWTPFPRAISLSVDAYVITSAENYANFGFEYQRSLLKHFGHGVMHFHCNRLDLAAEVLKLPGLCAFQFGGDTRDQVPAIEYLPKMRKLAGDLPLIVACTLEELQSGLTAYTLPPNTWYLVQDNTLSLDETNRLMERVRAYRI